MTFVWYKTGFSWDFGLCFEHPLLVIGGVLMAFLVNWQISLVFLISVPVLVLLILWVIKKASPLFTKVASSVGPRQSGHAREFVWHPA